MEVRDVVVRRLFMFTDPHDPHNMYVRLPDDENGEIMVGRVASFDTHEQAWIHYNPSESECNPFAVVRAINP